MDFQDKNLHSFILQLLLFLVAFQTYCNTHMALQF
jgi:hypothetical protein